MVDGKLVLLDLVDLVVVLMVDLPTLLQVQLPMVFHPRHRVTLVVTSLVLLLVALVVVDGEMQDLSRGGNGNQAPATFRDPSNPFGTPGPGGTFYFAGGGGAGKYQANGIPGGYGGGGDGGDANSGGANTAGNGATNTGGGGGGGGSPQRWSCRQRRTWYSIHSVSRFNFPLI